MSQVISEQVQDLYEGWIDWEPDDWNVWEELMLLRHNMSTNMPSWADAVSGVVEGYAA